MAEIMRRAGAFKPAVVKRTFDALVLSIIHQQISMKAAQTIAGRVRRLCPNRRLSPAALSSTTDTQLRKAGLSRQKTSYMRSVCEHFSSGSIRQAKLSKLADEEAIEALVDIKGVGVWTAEMILMFNLERPDVWPVDDLGLRIALQKSYRISPKSKRERLVRAGERFRPYRSVATWYLWRSLDGGILPGFT
jgi:DNA-3-methyladenine glycosylase II